MTADTDDRVSPGMAMKFAARLQQSDAWRPALIRIETKARHGAGKPVSKMIEEDADILEFLERTIGWDDASSLGQGTTWTSTSTTHSRSSAGRRRLCRAFLAVLTDPWIRGVEGPDTFSAFDVVGHLIDGEETDWMERARDHPGSRGVIPASRPTTASVIVPATWAGRSIRYSSSSRDCGRRISSRFDPGSSPRRILPCRGFIPTFGRVTLRQLLSAWVVHDLGHVRRRRASWPSSIATRSGRGCDFSPC